MKKLIFLFLLIAIDFCGFSQDDKTVTLTVSAQGKTKDEAKKNALRSAIEQAFGAFISSKTEILNDELIKDEIISVANGNIQKYEIISEVKIPGGSYATSLKATISVVKLTSFVESKGVVVKFKGNILAANVKQQMLNESNEVKSIKNIATVCKGILDKSFDYEIVRGTPKQTKNKNWSVPISINVTLNENIELFAQYLHNSIKGLAMSENEIEQYKNLGKETYAFALGGESKTGRISVRPNGPDRVRYKKSERYKFLNKLISKYETSKNLSFILRLYDIHGQDIHVATSGDIKEIVELINSSHLEQNYYKISFWDQTEESSLFHFRDELSVPLVLDIIYYLKHAILNFQITNGIKDFTPVSVKKDKWGEHVELTQNNFILTQDNLTPIFLVHPTYPISSWYSFENQSLFCDKWDWKDGFRRIIPYSFLDERYCYLSNETNDNLGIHNYSQDEENKFNKIYKKYLFLIRSEFYEDTKALSKSYYNYEFELFRRKPLKAIISLYDFINYSEVKLSFSYNDILTLSEIEQVKEYKISPL